MASRASESSSQRPPTIFMVQFLVSTSVTLLAGGFSDLSESAMGLLGWTGGEWTMGRRRVDSGKGKGNSRFLRFAAE